jgi:hypothetical protein
MQQFRLTMPPTDGRTREARALAMLRAELQLRLGEEPSFEARQVAEQILRTSHDISLLERQRHEGTLSSRDHEILIRRENALARLLDRLAPWPVPPGLLGEFEAEHETEAA